MRPIDQEIDGSSFPDDDEWRKTESRQDVQTDAERGKEGERMERQLDMIGM